MILIIQKLAKYLFTIPYTPKTNPIEQYINHPQLIYYINIIIMFEFPSIPIFFGFVTFNKETKNPEFSQYNFNFDMYRNDFNLEYDNKYMIFKDFYIRNGSTFQEKYTVKENLVKYFLPMTQTIIDYINHFAFAAHYGRLAAVRANGMIPRSILLEQQFDIVNYNNNNYNRVEDFYSELELLNQDELYTKYNFKFTEFSNDFEVYGTKRLIFCLFIIRNQYLKDSDIVSNYGLYRPFAIYFDLFNLFGLKQYMSLYGVNSNLDPDLSKKSFFNINWNKFIIKNKLDMTEEQAKEYWLQYGQFEKLIIPFNVKKPREISKLVDSVCQIIYDDNTGTGFAVSNLDDNEVYIMTCLHIFKIGAKCCKAVFNFFNTNTNTRESVTAELRVIGKDTQYDLALLLFDKTLLWNQTYNVDLSSVPLININDIYDPDVNDQTIIIGILGETSDISVIEGRIMEPTYKGLEFDSWYEAEYILSQNTTVNGISGSPQFTIDRETGEYVLISMIQRDSFGKDTISLGILVEYISNFVSIAAFFWKEFTNNGKNINYPTFEPNQDISLLKPWLGASLNYFDRKKITGNLKSLSYTGGMIVDEVIFGYNILSNKIVNNTFEINNPGYMQTFNYIENTLLYKRFIESSNPIVIKSLTYYDCLLSNYVTLNLGKYKEQDSYAKFLNGFQPIVTFKVDPSLNFRFNRKYEFPDVTITYYYFNGKEWIEETTNTGQGNQYCSYNLGFSNIIVQQNKWQRPPFISLLTNPNPNISDLSYTNFSGYHSSDYGCSSRSRNMGFLAQVPGTGNNGVVVNKPTSSTNVESGGDKKINRYYY